MWVVRRMHIVGTNFAVDCSRGHGECKCAKSFLPKCRQISSHTRQNVAPFSPRHQSILELPAIPANISRISQEPHKIFLRSPPTPQNNLEIRENALLLFLRLLLSARRDEARPELRLMEPSAANSAQGGGLWRVERPPQGPPQGNRQGNIIPP